MFLCDSCKSKEDDFFNFTSNLFGDGCCKKHGRFSFHDKDLKIFCYECAEEKNKCQKCGKKVKNV